MYGRILQGSVTRLEQYASCAYAHFLKYGLELMERQEYERWRLPIWAICSINPLNCAFRLPGIGRLTGQDWEKRSAAACKTMCPSGSGAVWKHDFKKFCPQRVSDQPD